MKKEEGASKDAGGRDEKSPAAKREETILKFWEEKQIFKKTLSKPSPKGEFIFYEGPPTANGNPAIHHLEARAFKDVLPRYKTMRGYHVRRKAGWDTHGLPVELEVEKQLGISTKKEIEQYGIANFNKKCKESVLKYLENWDSFTKRIGYWVDQDDAYFTFNTPYIESLWWAFAQTEKKNLLYKDYKIIPWCPRCGTALSSHELAQAYQEVKDISAYVLFKLADDTNVSLLAWTTTPWTLPGNTALAVNPDITYVKMFVKTATGHHTVILAKDRIEVLGDAEVQLLEEFKGSALVGIEYKPLFPWFAEKNIENKENGWKIYAGNFVAASEGTGVVHIAPAFGEDDMNLAKKYSLPFIQHVGVDGKFTNDVPPLAGRAAKPIEDPTSSDVEVIKLLAAQNSLFKKEKITHAYPHCWRCKTPLIYYARHSWYIRMSALRSELIAENKKINWEPAHIKEGRFGEWLREVKDWAISRERYWGTPLPIWVNKDGSRRIVVDSVETLKKLSARSGNQYFLVRHGEAEHQLKGWYTQTRDQKYALTKKGKEESARAASALRSKNIKKIYVSPTRRCQETAAIIAKELGLAEENVITDDRLRELDFGGYADKPGEITRTFLKTTPHYFTDKIAGGESLLDAKRRFGEFIYEREKTLKNENVLIVSHSVAYESLTEVTQGAEVNVSTYLARALSLRNAEVQKIDFVPLPHNGDYELDLHRPHIDEVVLVDERGEEYRRVPEVMDVWFDSGAMPFAQDHYPFENKKWVDQKGYPADFISEAIDQTRGWFYTLHAIGVFLGRGRAYKNVICLGHLLDKDGKKMSKSIGNVVDPWKMMEKYGADALRLWMYSINQPGESKNFDEKTVDEVVKKIFNLYLNVLAFYELYRDTTLEKNTCPKTSSPLDRWILLRLNELIKETTVRLDSYQLLEPVRSLRNFIDDLSTWYLRRSRDRMKENDDDARAAKQTLYYVLKTLAKIMAPFAPFIAEEAYGRLRLANDPESVHLEWWPEARFVWPWERDVLPKMAKTRTTVSRALEARAKAGIKIRQPLARLELKNDTDHLDLIKDEVNVKEVVFNPLLEDELRLDTTITDELKDEGLYRDLFRAVQEARKDAGLRPAEHATLALDVSPKLREIVENNIADLEVAAALDGVDFKKLSEGQAATVGEETVTIQLRRVHNT